MLDRLGIRVRRRGLQYGAPIRARVAPALLLVFAAIASSRSQPQSAPANSPQSWSAAYDQAFELLQRGKAAEALTPIDTALARDPSDPRLYNLRGLAYSQLGDAKEAEASFRKVVQLSPASAIGYVNLATLLSHQGRPTEAADLFRAALRREPHNFAALLGLGVTLAGLEKYEQAAVHLCQASKIRPDDFQAGYECARALRETKRLVEAQEVLKKVSPPPDPARASKYYELSGVVAEDRGDHTAAARLYARAYGLAPDSFDLYLALIRTCADAASGSPGGQPAAPLPPSPLHLSPGQHFILGTFFASRGDYPLAVSHFEETLRAEPASYTTAFNLVLSYSGAGKNDAAIELAEKTLKGKPTAELFDLVATLDEKSGRYLDALQNYQRAVELEPGNEQYYFDLGSEYLAHFTFGPALEVFTAGAEKFPKALREHVGLGFAHYAQREYLEAARAFLTALEIDPSSPTAFLAWNSLPAFLTGAEWNTLLPRLGRLARSHSGNAEALYCYGASLFQYQLAQGQHDFELPQSLLERASLLQPSLPEAHLQLGNLCLARSEKAKAASEFREAIRLDPDSELAHYRLGQVYRDLNKLDLAQQELARYTQLARHRREEMARSRRAIKQFILAQSRVSSRTIPETTPNP